MNTEKLEKTSFLKTAYNQFNGQNLDNLISYLNQIGGKPLTTKCKRQNALKTHWLDKEIKLLARCHAQNAAEYLYFKKENITQKQLRTVIADIVTFVTYLDPNEDTSFILLSTNTEPSVIQFDSAKRLFYNHQIGEQYQNNYSTDLLTLYALRLSLENRIRGLLGIDYATTNGKNIGLSILIKVAKELKSVEYSDKIVWTEIEWVNNWLNHHMHRHIRPYTWIIHQAIEVLTPFIALKETLINSNRTYHSIYSSTFVNDESELQKEIELKLLRLYPEIKIKWRSKREIVKRKLN